MKTDNNKNVNKSFNNGFLSKTTGNKMVLQAFFVFKDHYNDFEYLSFST